MRMQHRTFLGRTARTGLAFVLVAGLYVAVPSIWRQVPDLVQHLLLVLTTIMGVYLLERAWLWRDIADWNRRLLRAELRSANKLVRASAMCRIRRLYYDRSHAAKDVERAIARAKERVWISGVAISENIRLGALLPTLSAQADRGLDVRILLLHALRSPAIFRCFLESSPEDVLKIMGTDRTKPPPEDPLFATRFFMDFEHSYLLLRNYPRVERRVRYYAHTPPCWLVIADDTAYFEPYTFGRGAPSTSANLCLGAQMPVWEFAKEPDGRPFRVLEDHFRKLWLTSDRDPFHVGAERADRDRVLQDIFRRRSAWFKHVCGALYGAKHGEVAAVEDRRAFPRRPCEEPTAEFRLVWDADGDQREAIATALDCSREGLAIRLTQPSPAPIAGDVVALEMPQRLTSRSAEFMLNTLIGRSENRFIVRHAEHSGILHLGIERQPHIAS